MKQCSNSTANDQLIRWIEEQLNSSDFRTSSVTSNVEQAMFLGGKWINFSWEKLGCRMQRLHTDLLYTVHCILYTVQRPLYTGHWILDIVHRTMVNVQVTMNNISGNLYTVQSSLLTEHSKMCPSLRGGMQMFHALKKSWRPLFPVMEGGTWVSGKHSQNGISIPIRLNLYIAFYHQPGKICSQILCKIKILHLNTNGSH